MCRHAHGHVVAVLDDDVRVRPPARTGAWGAVEGVTAIDSNAPPSRGSNSSGGLRQPALVASEAGHRHDDKRCRAKAQHLPLPAP